MSPTRVARAGAAPDAAKAAARERRVRRAVRAGIALLHALARTWRIRCANDAVLRDLRAARQPVLFACWHGELLPLLWYHRDQGISVLVSEHSDGEIIARIAQRLGFGAVRGSTSRGGGRALLAMVRVLGQGGDVAVTPDGPRGPAHSFAPGALIAAQRAGVPILPTRIHVDRAWRLRSWDRFVIPKPFARVTIAYGPPTRVAAETMRDAAEETARFAALQEEAGRVAARAAGAG
ncbi:MAG TPA: lysophospholipid acyltransferase family protein [Gemmatimonadaceae bacterium]|nr:lysophospholipid acyltransferase family protein [Gemmatimonadaceae bacterium]